MKNRIFNWPVLPFVMLSCCFISFGCGAQDLERKGFLGIQMRQLPDSTAQQLDVEKGKGLLILNVFPNSTAAQVGMQPNAVLTELNNQPVNTIPELLDITNSIRENDQVSMTFLQNGKRLRKTTKAKPKPTETSEDAEVFYGQVNYQGNQLRSILLTPKGVKKAPVVFYLQGYTCGSIDFANIPFHTSRRLIDDWVKAGYAVYRVEKPNVGDSKCDKGCPDMNFNEEFEAFRQAYMTLQKDPRIDPENIVLFGHSMGGIVGPLLAKEFKPKGLVTYGIIINSWFEYMQELTRVQGEMFNTPYAEIERTLRNGLPFWYDLFVAQKSNDEILKNETIKNNLKEEGILASFEAGQYLNRHYTYWASLNQISLVDTWLEVECNVLALYGEFDIQALNATPIKTIANIVNAEHPGKGKYQIIPNADHGFVYFDSMEQNVNTLNNGHYLSRMKSHYDSGVATATIEWMNSITR